MIKVYYKDQLRVYVQCQNESTYYEISDHFSYFVENYIFMPKYKTGEWDGRYNHFNYIEKSLPIGLLKRLVLFSRKKGYKISFEENLINRILNRKEDPETIRKYLTIANKFDLRDYQQDCVDLSFKYTKGLFQLATGAGKSLIIYNIIRYLIQVKKKRMMLIVPSIMLVNQMFKDFREYGWEEVSEFSCLLYTNKKLDASMPLLITTWQSVYKKHKLFFGRYDGMIVDEVHGLKINELGEMIKKTNDQVYKYGFTGTMSENECSRIAVISNFGDQLKIVKTKELQEEKHLSDILVHNYYLRYNKEYCQEVSEYTYQREENFINKYTKRNNIFKHIFDKPKNQNSLILCKSISHIEQIEKYLIENLDDSFKIAVIMGKIKPKQREEIRMMTEKNTNVILVCTYGTMSTGVNIKRLHNVVFASSCKSLIRVLQSIGRGLRLYKDKVRLNLYDLIDDLRTNDYDNYMYKHSNTRKSIYRKQGFKMKDGIFNL